MVCLSHCFVPLSVTAAQRCCGPTMHGAGGVHIPQKRGRKGYERQLEIWDMPCDASRLLRCLDEAVRGMA